MKALKESILADMESTISNGDKQVALTMANMLCKDEENSRLQAFQQLYDIISKQGKREVVVDNLKKANIFVVFPKSSKLDSLNISDDYPSMTIIKRSGSKFSAIHISAYYKIIGWGTGWKIEGYTNNFAAITSKYIPQISNKLASVPIYVVDKDNEVFMKNIIKHISKHPNYKQISV